MYRIHFKSAGFFCIQILTWGLFWVSVRDGKGVACFNTFDMAVESVTKRGLDKLYEDKSHNKFREYMKGARKSARKV